MPPTWLPVAGALVAGLANLAPVPLFITGIEALADRRSWLRQQFAKVERVGAKYGKYDMWALTLLAPVIGVYVGVAVGASLRFRPWPVLASLSLLATAFLTTLGGGALVNWA